MATTPNKRQRTADQSLHISNLPEGILSHVASYLAQPAKALFAVAMTATSKSWTKGNFRIGSKHQQTVASIISSDEWDVLDFEDIEKSLAVKLTDDVHSILKCISAQDVLKKLKLSGCINITGRALEPLRGSSIIEHIDLCLVKQYETPKLNPEPMISEEVVIPILDSIITTNGNSMKMIVIPKKWRLARTTELAEFLGNYNRLLESRNPKCSKCERGLDESMRELDLAVSEGTYYFGKQPYCCYKCTRNFCYESDCNVNGALDCCICEKVYCADCSPMLTCHICSWVICKGCSEMETCDECFNYFCDECGPETANLCSCYDGMTYCRDCIPDFRHCTREGCNKLHCAICELCNDPTLPNKPMME